MTSPDMAPLFSGGPVSPGMPMTFRQGVIVEWNPLTAENVVEVDGGLFTNLPCLNSTEALLLTPGTTVGLMCAQGSKGSASWAILGRLTIPGTPSAATALSAISRSIWSEDDATSGLTTVSFDTGFGPLDSTAGPAVDVTIGPSGTAIAAMSMRSGIAGGQGVYMGFTVSGASTIPAAGSRSLYMITTIGGSEVIFFAHTRLVRLTGLNPGAHTFTAVYAHEGSIDVQIVHRNLTVIAL